MPEYGNLTTNKAARETMRDIQDCFRRWGVTLWDAPQPAKIGGVTATIRFELNGEPKVLECDRFKTYATNLRAVYLALDGLRLASQRRILEQYRQFFKALPDGESSSSSDDPYSILGVQHGAPLAVAEAAYRVLSRSAHPDVGGSAEAFHRLQIAIERIRDGAPRSEGGRT